MAAQANQKKKVDKRKKPKQKQKQKQIVKQNVKVTVQSSGGSGGGGSSQPIPQPFMDRNGENVRLQNLIEQISRKVRTTPMESNDLPIPTNYPTPAYRPSNDPETLSGVFQAPIDFGIPIAMGPPPKARKVYTRKPKITIAPSESEGESSPRMSSAFQEPQGYPSQSSVMSELRAKQKLGELDPNFM